MKFKERSSWFCYVISSSLSLCSRGHSHFSKTCETILHLFAPCLSLYTVGGSTLGCRWWESKEQKAFPNVGGLVRVGGSERARETALSCFLKRERRKERCEEERAGQSYGCEAQRGTTSVLQMWPQQLSDTKRKKKEKRGFSEVKENWC